MKIIYFPDRKISTQVVTVPVLLFYPKLTSKLKSAMHFIFAGHRNRFGNSYFLFLTFSLSIRLSVFHKFNPNNPYSVTKLFIMGQSNPHFIIHV